MKFGYSVAITVLFSGYACAADVLNYAKKESFGFPIVLGSDYHYSGNPDSEEKMFVKAIIHSSSTLKMKQNLYVLRADSPFPIGIEEITVSQSADVVDVPVKELLTPLCLSARDRKDSGVSSVSSYGSMSTITLEATTGIETPVSVDTPPVLRA